MPSPQPTNVRRRRLTVRGIVQGVGFRPHVVRVATQSGVTGTCRNAETAVYVQIQGQPKQLAEFEDLLRSTAPALAHIVSVEAEDLPVVQGEEGFRILASGEEGEAAEGRRGVEKKLDSAGNAQHVVSGIAGGYEACGASPGDESGRANRTGGGSGATWEDGTNWGHESGWANRAGGGSGATWEDGTNRGHESSRGNRAGGACEPSLRDEANGVRGADCYSWENGELGANKENGRSRWHSGSAARAFIPPDVALCEDCARELRDPQDRRYGYPFITCTNCGPRLSIIEDLPYDRERTTMAHFEMCPECAAEYRDPEDRRFHAQPISCFACGPQLWIEEGGESTWVPAGEPVDRRAQAAESLARARELLAAGKIVAVKGIGGFHLMVDACNEDAVQRLRERKHRPAKPLAVMMPSLAVAREYVQLTAAEEELLCAPARPIVIARARAHERAQGDAWARGGDAGEARGVVGRGPRGAGTENETWQARQRSGESENNALAGVSVFPDSTAETNARPIAPSVAPCNGELGVILPYTPVHELLVDRPVVATSGNLSGEPLCFTNEDAREKLADIADAWLMNDRPIVVPVEDSVFRGLMPVRRSRGFAPVPLMIPRGAWPGGGNAEDVLKQVRENTEDDSTPGEASPGEESAGDAAKQGSESTRNRSYAGEQTAKNTGRSGGENSRDNARMNEQGVGDSETPESSAPGVVLAVGGELKNTVTLVERAQEGAYFHVSAHIGDMESLASQQAWARAIRQLESARALAPSVIVRDLHPSYATTAAAERMGEAQGVPVIGVQHHYAHALSLLADRIFAGEADSLAGPAVIAAVDGTGYGTDGTIWGGEILPLGSAPDACARTPARPGANATGSSAESAESARSQITHTAVAAPDDPTNAAPDHPTEPAQPGLPWTRAWHVPYFALVGGDRAITHPWRLVAGIERSWELDFSKLWERAVQRGFTTEGPISFGDELALVRSQLDRGMGAVRTSSLGRVFDAAAAVVALARYSPAASGPSAGSDLSAAQLAFPPGGVFQTYEAQAAVEAEQLALAWAIDGSGVASSPLAPSTISAIPAGQRSSATTFPALVAELVEGALGTAPTGLLLRRFHDGVARLLAEQLSVIATQTGVSWVGVTGGCAVNTLFIADLRRYLQERGLKLVTHRVVPAGDGGLSVGQAVAALFA